MTLRRDAHGRTVYPADRLADASRRVRSLQRTLGAMRDGHPGFDPGRPLLMALELLAGRAALDLAFCERAEAA
jgi:hypothetical protein